MLARLFAELGPWNWMVLGFVLLVLEIVVPGVFLLWIGVAALIIGAVSLALWEASIWSWQVQVVAFLMLAVASALIGKRLMGSSRDDNTDQPLLNRRAQQIVGRVATLDQPIRDGRGRLQVDDTVWRITGPDLPAGARVRVASVGQTELELVVEAV